MKLFVYMSVKLANRESRRNVWGQTIIRFSNITKDGNGFILRHHLSAGKEY